MGASTRPGGPPPVPPGAGGGASTKPVAAEPPAEPSIDTSPIDVAQAYKDSNLESVLRDLDNELVGLVPVKTRIREITALLLVARLREQSGMARSRPTLHMSFTGRPGTGKTTVALRMARILHGLGYVRRAHVVVATRDDLVGQYVGHTAPKTKEVLKRAIGGVLFIDEAYYLYRPDNERDYGPEAIEILLQVMENQRDELVVIFAGYGELMERFYQANAGLRSRIGHHIEFPDYTVDELMIIAERMLAGQQYEFDAAAKQAFREYIERRVHQPHFANARSVRNALDRATLRQANRLVGMGGQIPRAELGRIDADDIRQSRVFAMGISPANDDSHPINDR